MRPCACVNVRACVRWARGCVGVALLLGGVGGPGVLAPLASVSFPPSGWPSKVVPRSLWPASVALLAWHALQVTAEQAEELGGMDCEKVRRGIIWP